MYSLLAEKSPSAAPAQRPQPVPRRPSATPLPASLPEVALRRGLIISAVLLGAFAAVVARHTIGPDGISYMDFGDALVRGDWQMAANGYWSPLYPLLLGLANRVVHPQPSWEFPVVHLVNFAIYLAALAGFACFWHALLPQAWRSAGSARRRLAWHLLGYAMFLWSSLLLIDFDEVSPDLLLAAIVFFATALLVRIHEQADNSRYYALLGLMLGLAYLTKAVMLVLAFVFIAASWRGRRSLPKMLIAAIVFLAACAPWAAFLSHSEGRLTFGETGRLNYLWYSEGKQNGADKYKLVPTATLQHPVQQVFVDPPVFRFEGGRNRAAYPFWYDASYWLEGSQLHFRLQRQLWVVLYNTVAFLMHTHQQYWFVFALLLLWQGWNSRQRLRVLARMALHRWFLLVLPMAAIALYVPVTVSSRFFAGFLPILWGVALLALANGRGARLLLPISAAAALIMTMAVVVYPGISAWYVHRQGEFSTYQVNLQVARELQHLGVNPGDRVASIGQTFEAYWSRLAHVSVVAEIPHEDAPRFWQVSPPVQRAVLNEFARSGAKVVVASDAPVPSPPAGWQRVDHTAVLLYRLQ